MEYLILISIVISIMGIIILVDSLRTHKRDNELKACKKGIAGISLCIISLIVLIVQEVMTGNMVKLYVDILFLIAYLVILGTHLYIYFKELK